MNSLLSYLFVGICSVPIGQTISAIVYISEEEQEEEDDGLL